MRVPTVSILLVGGVLALGACSTSGEPVNLTRAERAEICRGANPARITPTGRQTGDVRRDYDCRGIPAGGWSDRSDRNVGNGRAQSAAINKALGGN